MTKITLVEKDNWLDEIRFVVFSDESFEFYREILKKY